MPGGRPPKFTSVEDLENAIQDYFDNLPTKQVVIGGVIEEVPRPTITGLALRLGFDSRQSFYDYEQREQFSYIIKRARLMIEHEYEMGLTGPNPAGVIFALKNLGRRDRQEMEHSGPEGGPIENTWTVEVVDAELTDT